MSTRRAAPGSEFADEKFASSSQFERGLVGSMVALRCTALEDPKQKELIWFVHFLSHRPRGMKSLVAALLQNHPEHFGTAEMVRVGEPSGQSYNTEQVKSIRKQLPAEYQSQFPLCGETKSDRNKISRQAMDTLRLKGLRAGDDEEWAAAVEEEKTIAARHPAGYPVADFVSICQRAAADDLENAIRRLCLDPNPESLSPWYFAGLMDALQKHIRHWVSDRSEGLVITEIGKQVAETLDYVDRSGQLTLLEGISGLGKSFAAESWCELHPGRARFIEVPTGNDETSFFRELARGLGIGSFAQYKAIEIRERVESVLLAGDVMIVLDQAWRLFPQQTEPRFGFPKRINWLVSMVDKGLPVCLISTPQFLHEMAAKREKGGWNCAQLVDRCQYQKLPDSLSMEDLCAVAAVHLPEAVDETLFAIADYARTSLRYLGVIKTISVRARYLAGRAGRDAAEEDDVRRAMQENVIPSNSQLVRALESKRIAGRRMPEATFATDDPQSDGSRAASISLLNTENHRSKIESVNTYPVK